MKNLHPLAIAASGYYFPKCFIKYKELLYFKQQAVGVPPIEQSGCVGHHLLLCNASYSGCPSLHTSAKHLANAENLTENSLSSTTMVSLAIAHLGIANGKIMQGQRSQANVLRYTALNGLFF